MTSAVGGGKGGPPKAEEINKQNQLIYVCDREGGSKNSKVLRMSYTEAPLPGREVLDLL